MLKDYSAFIGVGQCGGNIVSEFELNDFDCFYVNTSLEDLETVGDNSKGNQFHIRNTKGMAKDRVMAFNTITSNECATADLIAESVYKKYANPKMYYFVTGASGGTGGGMTNTIIKSFKEMYPEKIINVIVVLPHTDEDMIMQSNAIEYLRDLRIMYKQGIVTNIQMLDNGKKDLNKKSSINKTISSLMNTVMSFQSLDSNGNLDEQELENIFATRGITVMHEFTNKDFQDEAGKVDENSIYNKIFKSATMQGFIFNKEHNSVNTKRIIQDSFGIAPITHETSWEDEETIVISAGVDFTKDILNAISKPIHTNYIVLKERKEQLESEFKNQISENGSFDIDAISFDDVVHSNVVTSTSDTAPRRRRGRGVGLKAEMSRIR